LSNTAHKRQLRRHGDALLVKPKALETLLLLLAHQDRVLTKAELIEHLWPETVVEESNLTQYIYLLRKTLGDSRYGLNYILTVQRRGYRFVADFRESNGAASHKPQRSGLPLQGRISDEAGEQSADRLWRASLFSLVGGVVMLVSLAACEFKDEGRGRKGVAIIPIEGGPPVQTFDLQPRWNLMRWTRDGQGIAYTSRANEISLFQLSGGSPRKILSEADDVTIFWFDLAMAAA
jgi:DNA-binding winged helix-turn-helix (wHTH) protein